MSKLEQKFCGFIFAIFIFPYLITLAFFKEAMFHLIVISVIFFGTTVDLWKMLFDIACNGRLGRYFVLALVVSLFLSMVILLMMEFFNYKNIFIVILMFLYWILFSFVFCRSVYRQHKNIINQYFYETKGWK